MKWFIRISAVLLVVGSLSLMVSTLMFPSATLFVSNAIESVSGTKTVYSKLKNDITDKDKKLTKQNIELDGLRKDRALKSTQIKNIKNRIIERAAWRVSRNISSLATQSIPYVGATAIVGLTVSELNDACNTMIDLQNLEKELKLPIEDESSVEKVCKLKEGYWEDIGGISKEMLDTIKKIIPDLPDLDLPDLPDLPDISPLLNKSKEWWNSITGEPNN